MLLLGDDADSEAASSSPSSAAQTCEYTSPRADCKTAAVPGRLYCAHHACPFQHCANPKSSSEATCPACVSGSTDDVYINTNKKII